MATRGSGGGRKPRDLVVRFLSDVAGFIKGTDDVADALDDVSASMDSTARDAATSSDKIARDYEAAAESMERSTDEFTRDLAASYRAAAARVRTENDKIKTDTKATFADTGREAGAELASNVGEAISSGDFTGVAAGTAGGMATALTAAGPAGIIAAAGLTLGTIFLTRFQAEATKIKAVAESTFEALRDGLLERAEQENLLMTALGVESAEEAYNRVAEIAAGLGTNAAAVYDELVSGGTAATELDDTLASVDGRVSKLRSARTPVFRDDELGRAREFRDLVNAAADGIARGESSARTMREALRLSALDAATLAESSYRMGGSVWNSQVPYEAGGRA